MGATGPYLLSTGNFTPRVGWRVGDLPEASAHCHLPNCQRFLLEPGDIHPGHPQGRTGLARSPLRPLTQVAGLSLGLVPGPPQPVVRVVRTKHPSVLSDPHPHIAPCTAETPGRGVSSHWGPSQRCPWGPGPAPWRRDRAAAGELTPPVTACLAGGSSLRPLGPESYAMSLHRGLEAERLGTPAWLSGQSPLGCQSVPAVTPPTLPTPPPTTPPWAGCSLCHDIAQSSEFGAQWTNFNETWPAQIKKHFQLSLRRN